MNTVLFAHERPSVVRAASHVLKARGFEVQGVHEGHAATKALERDAFDALVVDVALPGRAGYELIEPARDLRARGCGARVIVLVASVFRKTSYKRRPARLYGADDYVELHHLGDMLPDKLSRHLKLEPSATTATEAAEQRTTEAVYLEGDVRFAEPDPTRLAALIVADLVLYGGDRIAATQTVAQAQHALADDLEVAVDLMRQVYAATREDEERASQRARRAVEDAFETLMRSMGRVGQ